jgi:hypothetical protein
MMVRARINEPGVRRAIFAAFLAGIVSRVTAGELEILDKFSRAL